jgi:hypothetical protein
MAYAAAVKEEGMIDRPLDPFVRDDPDASSFEDRRLGQLLDYWRALPRTGDLPAVETIDPAALVFILGWLMIIDPIDGGVDFSYRLYGTNIAEVTGRDLTGCKLSDSFPQVAAFASAVYRDAMRDRQPVLTRHTPPRQIMVSRWERLILPFAGPDDSVARFLVGAVGLGMRRTEKRRLPWPLRDESS